MRLTVAPAAVKSLRAMPAKAASALVARLRLVASDPFARQANVERMTGMVDAFRLRHGDWRAIYRIDRERQEMVVDRIAHRREVYR